ncbi:MAG TPA: hypothetical protein VFF68_04310 [Anaerolineaceae bacterium]|nr:hypothetical protein [Anaerolineaceae bacterium]
MNRKPIAIVLMVLFLSALACSGQTFESLGKQAQTPFAAGGQTVAAKGDTFLQTQAAGLFATAKAEVVESAPQLKQTAQTALLTEAPQWIETAQAYVITQGPEFQQTAEALIATEGPGALESLAAAAQGQWIVARAYDWVEAAAVYDPAGERKGYRTDGAGLVSYAWDLKENGQPVSPDAQALAYLWSTDITYEALVPGDTLNNRQPGEAGLVVLFLRWLDDTHTRFAAYELSASTGAAIEVELTLDPVPGGFTIREREAGAPGPYLPQRKK